MKRIFQVSLVLVLACSAEAPSAAPVLDAGSADAAVPDATISDSADGGVCEAPANPGSISLCTDVAAGVLGPKPPLVRTDVVVVNLPGLGDVSLKRTRGLTYGVHGGLALYGDLYQPIAPAAPPGILMHIHGGGWNSCDNRLSSVDAVLRTYAALGGFAVFNVEYRMVREGGQFPENLRDVKCAAQWIASKASSYGLDGSKLVLSGDSAGAHLAALMAETGARADLSDSSCGAVNPKISGVLAFSGIYDFQSFARVASFPDPMFGADGNTPRKVVEGYVLRSCTGSLAGCDPAKSCAVCTDASPAAHACSGSAPYLLIHAPETYDPLVPASQSTIMRDALSAAGRTVTLLQPTVAEMTSFGAACPDPKRAHALTPCLVFPTLKPVIDFLKPKLSP
jgi:acetyl esterase/lipase